MYNSQYKYVKHNLNAVYLDNILKHSDFIGFFQIKSLDSKSYLELKKQFLNLNLNILICKKTNIVAKIEKLSSNNALIESMVKGNIAIVYSGANNNSIEQNGEKILDIITNNKHIIPLFFIACKYFFTSSKLVNILKISLKAKFNLLISLLATNSYNALNILEHKKL